MSSKPSDRKPGQPPAPRDRRPAGAGSQTLPSQNGARRGKLPHERDESAGPGAEPADRASGERAYGDASSERVDTDCALSGRDDCPANPTGSS